MADQRGVILLLLCTCLTIEAAPVQSPELGKDGNISAAEVKDPEVKIFLQELEKNTTELDQLAAAGNVMEAANVVTSIALLLNNQKVEEKSAEDIEESKKLRETIVDALMSNANVTELTSSSLDDVTQFTITLVTDTRYPAENTEEEVKEVSSVMEDASKAILKQAIGVDKTSSVVNNIRSASSSSEPQQTKEASENITRKVLKTINTLATALLAAKVPGEEETTIETSPLAVGVSRENAGDIGNKPIDIAESEVAVPASNLNSSLERVGMLSLINLYPGKERPGQNSKSNLVLLPIHGSLVNSSREAFNSSQISVALNFLGSEMNKTKERVEGAGHEFHYNSSWLLTATSEDGSEVYHL